MVPERPLGGVQGPGNWVWAELWTTDLEATLARARELGGEVLLEPNEEIYEGCAAVLASSLYFLPDSREIQGSGWGCDKEDL